MIIDIEKFIAAERHHWEELDGFLHMLSERTGHRLRLEEVRRFNYLYQRAASDLARLSTFPAETATRRYLEDLVGRAYTEVHDVRRPVARFNPGRWVMETLPQTFRRHVRAFHLTLVVTMLGGLFGAFVVGTDNPAKRVLLPFDHLMGDPSDRVADEESETDDHMAGHRALFSAELMQNNIRVSITALALGMTWGLGTLLMLFYNGIILGAVVFDYVAAGETVFLIGWLLPHGSIELPAIFLAGQAGLVLAHALIGFGDHQPMRRRLRAVGPDLVTLIAGVAIMLVWAGIVESFFSQYHEPLLPYWIKITFGTVELVALFIFLYRSGRGSEPALAEPRAS